MVHRLAQLVAAPLLISTAEFFSQLVPERSCWKDAIKHLRIGDPFVEAELRTFLERPAMCLTRRWILPGLFHGRVVELYPVGSLGPVWIEVCG